MSNPNGSWVIEGFPEQVTHPQSDPPDEVQKAYEAWLQTLEINPKRVAARMQGDDVRYSARVPGACYADHRGGWQLWCDFEVYEDDRSSGGRAVFIEMGYVAGADVGGWGG